MSGTPNNTGQSPVNFELADAGVESLLGLANGELQAAYIGLTPYALALRYGMPIVPLAVSNKIGQSHKIVCRTRVPKSLLLATPSRSTSHQIGWHWAGASGRNVTFVDLRPGDAVKAFEMGLVDGVSLWEPFASQAVHLGGQTLFTGEDLPVPLWNLLVGSNGTNGRVSGSLEQLVEAHKAGCHKLASRDSTIDEACLDYLGAVLRLESGPDAARKMLLDEHEWPIASEPPDLSAALYQANTFLDSIGLTRSGQSASPKKSVETLGGLTLGYSPSIMCAPMHIATYFDELTKNQLRVHFAMDAVIERTARLEPRARTLCLELARRTDDPDAVVVICGARVEQALRAVSASLGLGPGAKSTLGLCSDLFEMGVLPGSVYVAATHIWSLRTTTQHGTGEPVEPAEAKTALRELVAVLEWGQDTKGRNLGACTRCGKVSQRSGAYCTNCGHAFQSSCKGCGSGLEVGARFCGSCGRSVKES